MASAKGNVASAKGNMVSAKGNVVSVKGNMVSAVNRMIVAKRNVKTFAKFCKIEDNDVNFFGSAPKFSLQNSEKSGSA